MVFVLFLISAFLVCLGTSKRIIVGNATKLDIPVTYYLGEIGFAYVEVGQTLYYSVKLCKPAMASAQQASLAISLPENTQWQSLDRLGFVMAQVSICQATFSSQCVIAQNYVWGAVVKAVPNIIWNIGNETTYYIRLLAGNIPAQFSLELSFTVDTDPYFFPWTTNFPFNGDTVTKIPTVLKQYWKSVEEYIVPNKQKAYFAFAYCNQGYLIDGIEVAVITSLTYPYSLIEQWACSQKYDNYTDCTQPIAIQNGWVNSRVASFNLLRCTDDSSKDTTNGIWVVVEGDGSQLDGQNYFSIQASLIL